VPVGICFPGASAGVIPERAPMEIRIGAPLMPPALGDVRPSLAGVRLWHAAIMSEIARLSGRSWHPRRPAPLVSARAPIADAA
jgi:hypothetical protein